MDHNYAVRKVYFLRIKKPLKLIEICLFFPFCSLIDTKLWAVDNKNKSSVHFYSIFSFSQSLEENVI